MRHNAGRCFVGMLAGMVLLGFGATARAGKPRACSGDVYADGRGSWPSIQSCIDGKPDGLCLVCDGTYYENIDFHGRAVTVKSVNGAAKTTIDGGGDARHDAVVKFVNGEGPGSILDGFTITNGRGYIAVHGDGTPFGGRYGGGIAISQSFREPSSPTIRNCVITGNSAFPGESLLGGGIGGALNTGSVTITGCTITNNAAFTGAGIALGQYELQGPSANITNTIVSGNQSGDNGGGIGIYGYMSADITNCTVSANTAVYTGGGVSVPTHGTVRIVGSRIHDNATTNTWAGHLVYGGGGVFFNGGTGSPGTLEITDSSIYKNNSPVYAGGVHVVYDGYIKIANSMIWGNTGGGVSIADINLGYGSATIVNSTIAYNQGSGGILYDYGTDSLTVANSIVWGNTAGGVENQIIAGWGSDINSIAVEYSDVQGGWAGTGNIDANPLFVDTTPADAAAWNLDIKSGSPCINAGDPASYQLGYPIRDIHGAPRALAVKGDGKWDVGADEYRRR